MQQLFVASGAFVFESLSIYFSTSKLLVNISPKIPFIFPRTLIHFRDVCFLLYLSWEIFILKNIFLFIQVKFYIYIFISIILKWRIRIRCLMMKNILSIPARYIIYQNMYVYIFNKYVFPFFFFFTLKEAYIFYLSLS